MFPLHITPELVPFPNNETSRVKLMLHIRKSTLFSSLISFAGGSIWKAFYTPLTTGWWEKLAVSAVRTSSDEIVKSRAAKPEPKTCRWWSWNLKFGFWFHIPSLWGKRIVQTIQWFSVSNGPNHLSRSQKLLDVWAVAGVTNIRCLEPEPAPEIWVPAPQPKLNFDQ